jgi:hypothetical protein
MAAVKSLGIFDEHIFYRDVYHPILDALGVQRSELRRPLASRKS